MAIAYKVVGDSARIIIPASPTSRCFLQHFFTTKNAKHAKVFLQDRYLTPLVISDLTLRSRCSCVDRN